MERKGFLINKAFRKYLWASILTVAATQVANIVDGALVGNIIGPEGLSSVIISRPVLQGIFAISCLYVVSSSMIAGMAMGNGDKAKANSQFTLSMVVSVVLGVLISAGGIVFLDPLMELLCKAEELKPMARSFMTVTILSAIPQLLMYTLHQFVTIDGSPNLISRAVIIGNLFNVGLDIVFMKYLGMGIAGAAWATCVMYVVCCLMILPHFRKKDTLRLTRGISRGQAEGGRLLALGTPLFLSTILISAQYTCYNNTAATYMGQYGLVALAVCIQLFSFSMIILTGCLRTIQPVGSILKGIGDSRGVMILLGKAYRFLAIGLAIYTLLIVCFPVEIAGLLGVRDAAATSTVSSAVTAFTLNIIMQALLYNLMPVYQFYGHDRMALFLSVGQTLLPIAGFWGLARLSAMDCSVCSFHCSPTVPWYGFFLGQLLTAIVLIVSAEIIRRKPSFSTQDLAPVCLVPREEERPSIDFSFGYSKEEMHQAFDGLTSWLKQQALSESVIFRVRIIAEELMSNITRHSEQKNKNAYADFRLIIDTEAVTFVLSDDGKPFNPTENSEKGYGLMIANRAASEISYKYQFDQNMTTVKVYKSPTT